MVTHYSLYRPPATAKKKRVPRIASDYRENDTSYPRAPGNTGYDSVARAQSKAKRADGRIAMSKWLQPKSEPGEAPQDVCLDRVLDGSASSMSCY